MRLSRLIAPLALSAALGTASACGGSAGGTGALGSTVDPSPSTPVATPTSAVPTPTPHKPAPSTTAARPTPSRGGDGDSAGDTAPATAGGGICGSLGAAQVGAVVGVRVTGAGIPGGGCKFTEGGARGIAVTFLDKAYAAVGGMAGAKSEATSAVEGNPEDLSGIGTAAFVVTGTMFGGTDVQGAGAVHVGTRMIQVFLVQGRAIAGAQVRSLVIDLLKLAARQSG